MGLCEWKQHVYIISMAAHGPWSCGKVVQWRCLFRVEMNFNIFLLLSATSGFTHTAGESFSLLWWQHDDGHLTRSAHHDYDHQQHPQHDNGQVATTQPRHWLLSTANHNEDLWSPNTTPCHQEYGHSSSSHTTTPPPPPPPPPSEPVPPEPTMMHKAPGRLGWATVGSDNENWAQTTRLASFGLLVCFFFCCFSFFLN